MFLPIDYLLGMGGWIAVLGITLIALVRRRQLRRRSGKSLRGSNWALAVWMFLAALTFPELACALFYDATDSFAQTNVCRRWFDRHVHTNRAGYRDAHELPTIRDSNKQYVVFVGDSFTFGHGVNDPADRFSDRVEKDLASENVVVSNAGAQAMEIRQLVECQLPDFLQQKTPVDVLVYTFVPNDIEFYDERTNAFYAQRARRDPSFFLWKNTYFYNLLYHRLQHLSSADAGEYYNYLSAAYTGEPWKRFAQKLSELHKWCRIHDAELQLVIFPFLTTLGPDNPFASAYATLEAECSNQGIACCNLTTTMTDHRSEGLVVSRFDSHPNPRAHALAAQAILPSIRERLKVSRGRH